METLSPEAGEGPLPRVMIFLSTPILNVYFAGGVSDEKDRSLGERGEVKDERQR